MTPFNFAEFKAQRAAMTPEERAAEVIANQERAAEVLAKKQFAEQLSEYQWRAALLVEAARHLLGTWPRQKGSFTRGERRSKESYSWVCEYPGVLIVTDKATGFRQAVSKPGQPAVMRDPAPTPPAPAVKVLPGRGGLD